MIWIKTDGAINFSRVNKIRSNPTQVIQITPHNHIASIFVIRTRARERPSSVQRKVAPVNMKKINTPLQRHIVVNTFLTTRLANKLIINKHRGRQKRLSSNPSPVRTNNMSIVPIRVEGGDMLIADCGFWISELIGVL